MFTIQEDSHHTADSSLNPLLAAPAPLKIMGIRLSALIEIALFFIAMLVIDFVAGTGTRFISVSPHPFWIILLLITVQYGAMEALFCAIIASLVLLVGNMPVQEVTENIYDYVLRTMTLPFLWIGTATILGGIRTRQQNERNSLREKLKHTDEQARMITKAYKKMMQQKESLERRLAEELYSSVTVYRAATALETIDQRTISEAVRNIMQTTMNPEKFSFFELNQSTGASRLVVKAAQGWGDDDNYYSSYSETSDLFCTIIGERRIVCVLNPDDDRILMGQGVIAGPIIDPATGDVFGMLKIEAHGLRDFTIRNIEIFRILCEWVGMAYVNTQKYQQALGEKSDQTISPIKEAVDVKSAS